MGSKFFRLRLDAFSDGRQNKWVDSMNGAKVYVHQNFLNVVVHVIIIGQYNQTARFYEIQVTVFNSGAILIALTLECDVFTVKRVTCKA